MPGAVTVRRWYTCCCCYCCCRCCDVVMFIVGKSKANDWKVVGNKYYLMFIYLVCRHHWYTSCGRCWCCPRLRGWNQSAGIRNSIFLTSLTWSNRLKQFSVWSIKYFWEKFRYFLATWSAVRQSLVYCLIHVTNSDQVFGNRTLKMKIWNKKPYANE